MVIGVVVIKMVYSFCWVDHEIRGTCGVNIMSSVIIELATLVVGEERMGNQCECMAVAVCPTLCEVCL